MDLTKYEQLTDELWEQLSDARSALSNAMKIIEKFDEGATLPIGANKAKEAYNLLC